jgi:hypothetical protein
MQMLLIADFVAGGTRVRRYDPLRKLLVLAAR